MVKTIKVSEDTHRHIKRHRRDGETMDEALNRLLRNPSLLDLYGLYAEEDVEEMRAAIDEADERGRDDVEDISDRFA